MISISIGAALVDWPLDELYIVVNVWCNFIHDTLCLSYTFQTTFSQRKAAKQEAVRVALECLSKKIKEDGWPLVLRYVVT